MPSLAQIKREIDELETKLSNLQGNYRDVHMIEASITQIARMFERMTGSPQIKKAMDQLERFIMLVRIAQATWHAFQVASGPIGWLFFATGVVATGLMVGDTMVELSSH